MKRSAMIRARDVRIPNAVSLRTFAETDAGVNLVPCENGQQMFARLGT